MEKDSNDNLAWAEIDLDRLGNNIDIIKKSIKENTKIAAVLKADAYGHGAGHIIEELNNKNIDMFVVGKLEEAIEISKDKVDKDILILGQIDSKYIEDNIQKGFLYSAYNIEFLKKISKIAKKHNKIIRIHLRIDVLNTGMGMSIEEYAKTQEEIFSISSIRIEGIYAHLYSAYSFNKQQIEYELQCFDNLVKSIPDKLRKNLMIHICNSALVFEYPQYHYDMVRVGTAIYGLPCHPIKNFGLEPVLSLKAKIINIHDVEKGKRVCYHDNTEGECKKVGRVLFGYWDCPMLMTTQSVKAWINGKLVDTIDEACMDSTCVDLTDLENIKVGDEVIFLGYEDGVKLLEVLQRAKIELLHSERVCITAKRLAKVYVHNKVKYIKDKR